MLTGFRSNEPRSATLRPGLTWQANLDSLEQINQFAPWGDNESPDYVSSHCASMSGAKNRPQTSKAWLPCFINFIPDIETYTQSIIKDKSNGLDSIQEDSGKNNTNNVSRPSTAVRRRKHSQQKNSKGTIRFGSPKVSNTQINVTRTQSPQDTNQRIQISFLGAGKGIKLERNNHKPSRSMKYDKYDASLARDNFSGQHEYLNSLSIERKDEENSVKFNEQINNIFCKFEEQTDRNLTTYKDKENTNNLESTDIKSDVETLQLTNRNITDRSSNESPKQNINTFGSLYMKILDESPLTKNMTYKEKKQEMKKLNIGSYRSFGEGLDSLAWNNLRENEYESNAKEIRKQRSKRDFHPLHMSNATFYVKEIQEMNNSTASYNLKNASSFAVITTNKGNFDLRTKDPALPPSVTKRIPHEDLKNGVKIMIERPKRITKQVNEDQKGVQESSKDKYIPSMLRCYKDNKKKYLLISNPASNLASPTHKTPESSENQAKGIKSIIQKIKSTDSLQAMKRPETSNITSKQLKKFGSYAQQMIGSDEQIMKRYLNSNSRPKQNLLESSNINRSGISGERKASLRQKVANLTELDVSKQRPDFDKSSFTTKNISSPMEKVVFMTPNGNQSKLNIRPGSGVWNMGIKNK